MSRARRAVLVGLLLSCAGCARFCGDARLAELVEVHGAPVERDFANAVNRWSTAEIGSGFALGDGVRAGPQAQAVLRLSSGAAVRLLPGTQLRFLADAGDAKEGAAALDVEMGEAEISTFGGELALHTREGVARLAPGSKVALRRAGERVVYRVEVGAATLVAEGSGKAERRIGKGEVVEVGIGMAVMEPRKGAGGDGDSATSTTTATTTGTGTSTGSGTGSGTGGSENVGGVGTGIGASAGLDSLPSSPDRVSLSVAAGESFTVHAARLPVGFALDLGERCAGEAVLVIDGKPRARGQGHVGALLNAGRHPYRVHCVRDGALAKEAAVEGVAYAVRDAGRASLPRKAPSSFVDADGKRYTVTYQNLLPKIVFSWPGAPAAPRYTLHVASAGKPSLFNSKQPEQSFAQGALREGTHELYFTTPDGARSKTTTLEIVFDNAAPKASLGKPDDGSFTPGAEVQVEGVALPNWKVSLPGGRLALDRQARFSGSATTTAARPDVTLRLESPRGEVHYYVRRASAD